MGNLLNFEFRKLVRQKSFYICNLVLVVLIFLSAFMTKALFDNMEEITQPLPTAVGMVQTALSGGNAALIIGIFVALFASEDYTDGTMKNIYAKGYSRTQVYGAKLVSVAFFSLTACLVSFAGSFAAGAVFFEIGSGLDIHTLLVLLTQTIVMVLGYTALFFAISMILKKTGSAIAGCIVAPMLISLLFGMADSFLQNDKFKFADYWLDGLFSSITQSASAVTNEAMLTAAAVSVVYAVICTAVGVNIVKRQEL